MIRFIKTFLDLAAFDEVYPNEKEVLDYVKNRLDKVSVPYSQDKAGNIVARVDGVGTEVVALCGHVDIVAPLNGRKVVQEGEIIKTDGQGLLGGDDKVAVAIMLELADELAKKSDKPPRTIELIFTVGEEAGLLGSKALDYRLVTAKHVLVFDWLGRVNRAISKSPGRYSIDIEYVGKSAHAGLWQQGKNAGAALMSVAAGLRQGDFTKDVIFNIGMVNIGEARNQVPAKAVIKAEIRSYDMKALENALESIKLTFIEGAKRYQLKHKINVDQQPNFILDQDGTLFKKVTKVLADMGLEPVLESTFAVYDANVFASRGLEAVALGAAYYNPHSSEEYVSIAEAKELLEFVRRFVQYET